MADDIEALDPGTERAVHILRDAGIESIARRVDVTKPMPKAEQQATQLICDDLLVERLASLAHEQWSGWTEYMLDNMDGVHIRGWRRQIATPYAELTEAEKESDRREARKVLAVLGAAS